MENHGVLKIRVFDTQSTEFAILTSPLGTVRTLHRRGVSLISRERFLYV